MNQVAFTSLRMSYAGEGEILLMAGFVRTPDTMSEVLLADAVSEVLLDTRVRWRVPKRCGECVLMKESRVCISDMRGRGVVYYIRWVSILRDRWCP